MNRTFYAVIFALICLTEASLTGCGGSSSSSTTPPPSGGAQVVGITATSGSSQSAASRTPFSAPLTATVTTGGIGTGGEKVTFTAPTSGAGGTFANGSTTETDVTDSTGVATSSTFTANAVSGAYQVTATVSGVKTPASFSLTNLAATFYSFYMSGQESPSGTGAYYALAGSVVIDASGNVLAGEQDYNDAGSANGLGFSSPEPGGAQITGGSLTAPSASGQSTLTLNTYYLNNNTTSGTPANQAVTETFAVQFVNPNHALIMQFDGTATSSGSLDLQTLPSTPSGSYAFALSGIDSGTSPDAFGGVFSVSGATLSNGLLDVNDTFNGNGPGTRVIGTPFSGTITPPDAYGRGTITGLSVSGSAVSLVYYMVGPEVMRLIDVDTGNFILGTAGDSAVGSAFGQGQSAGTFSNASLGQSVFAIAGNVAAEFAALGQFTTSNCPSSDLFCGVGDVSDPTNGIFRERANARGVYSIDKNGYGGLSFSSLSINYAGLGDLTILGIYMTDPGLNLEDPNNTTGGGGALVVDLDDGTGSNPNLSYTALPGLTGVIIPQTDTTTAAFNGSYVVGWQNFNYNFCACEFDMIAQGTMAAAGNLSLIGSVSDPSFTLGTPDPTSSSDTFIGTPLPDQTNPGRYTMQTTRGSLAAVIDGVPIVPNFFMSMYQASGDQLFWMDYDGINETTVSIGPLEQQPSPLTGLPTAKKRAASSSSNKR